MSRTTSSLAIFAVFAFACSRPNQSAHWTDDAGAAQASTARATLQRIRGSVTVKRAAADDWSAAVEQMVLNESDKVRTGKGAQAQLVFLNGSVVGMGEDALVGLVPGPSLEHHADLTVLKGRVDAQLAGAEKSLSLATPSATIRAGREIVFQ